MFMITCQYHKQCYCIQIVIVMKQKKQNINYYIKKIFRYKIYSFFSFFFHQFINFRSYFCDHLFLFIFVFFLHIFFIFIFFCIYFVFNCKYSNSGEQKQKKKNDKKRNCVEKFRKTANFFPRLLYLKQKFNFIMLGFCMKKSIRK